MPSLFLNFAAQGTYQFSYIDLQMKTGRNANTAAWAWLVAVVDVALLVGSVLLAYALMRALASGHSVGWVEALWCCALSSACYLLLTVYLPSVALRPQVRADELMQRCFRKAVLLYVFTCCALSFLRGFPVAHVFLLLALLIFAVVLFLEWLLVRSFARLVRCRRLRREGSEAEEEQDWEVYELPQADEPLSHCLNQMQKRAFDLLISLLFLLTVYPIIYMVLFVITKLRRHSSVYVVRRSAGMGGKQFSRLQFRCGRGAVRGWPMLLNVFAGSMSLVGSVVSKAGDGDYLRLAADSEISHKPKPGLVSWAGLNGFSLDEGDAEECLRSDEWYARNWSFWLDVSILLQSLFRRR